MFHRLFQNIRLDRRSLFHAMRFAKLSTCQFVRSSACPDICAISPSESLDGFDRQGHSLDRDIIGRAFDASDGGFGLRALFSHDFARNSLIYDRIRNRS
jgi:hypothetical protein